jgi:hypothetical protein
MTTEHDRSTRIVLSWLREDVHENAERVLLLALDQVDTTPQRRSWWPAWRTSDLNKLSLTVAAAAAVLVIAFVGYNLLPKQGGAGGPNATPSPSPAPLAVGTFTSHGVAAQLDAQGAGDSVTGTLTVSDTGLRATVDLECSRRADGLLFIGGLVSDSTFDDFFPEGRRVGVIFEPGSPVKALWLIALIDEVPAANCQTLADDLFKPAEATAGLEPISGTVELAP